MKRIAIIGLGLLGGSFALAVKRDRAVESEIIGFSRRQDTVAEAKNRGVIDEGAENLASAVNGAELVVITTPVLAIKDVLEKISGVLSPGCIVTDTGSTKKMVMEWAKQYLPQSVNFIGGHPMAGKETSGLDEADAELFRGCIYCLTPAGNATRQSVKALGKIVNDIGASPWLIRAEEHDRLVAGVSHLPMLLSSAFVSATTGNSSWPEMSKMAAGGYRDLSRLASGNPEMNRDICVTNREEIIRWLDCYIEELKKYRQLVSDDGEQIKDVLAVAREARERWLGGGMGHEA
ncbi:MAG: prephenate dehydrogenase [Dehalococcoidales bacterium]|nr:prephenate dehydrogenase [Dehalococcoidales bacterium]